MKKLTVVWTGAKPDGSAATFVGTCDCSALAKAQRYPGGSRDVPVDHDDGCAALDPEQLVEVEPQDG